MDEVPETELTQDECAVEKWLLDLFRRLSNSLGPVSLADWMKRGPRQFGSNLGARRGEGIEPSTVRVQLDKKAQVQV